MTLLPVESRVHIRGVAAERYPLNPMCSNPECDKPGPEPHHIFRRKEIVGDSWFVELSSEGPDGQEGVVVLPHVTGMCHECHKNVTENRWWIKLEGQDFVLYAKAGDPLATWEKIGKLAPQPGGRDVPPKRRKRLSGEARATRKSITLRIPETDERPTLAEQYDEMLPQVEALLSGPEHEDKHRSPIYTIVSAFGYVLLNEGHETHA